MLNLLFFFDNSSALLQGGIPWASVFLDRLLSVFECEHIG